MKALRKFYPVLLVALALTRHAYADHLDTKGLMAMCNSKQDNLVGSCIGYIDGVAETMALSQIVRNLPQCVPDSATTAQLYGSVASYMQKHPDNSSAPAVVTVSLALSETFNCTKQEK
jgi:hypothetical protein